MIKRVACLLLLLILPACGRCHAGTPGPATGAPEFAPPLFQWVPVVYQGDTAVKVAGQTLSTPITFPAGLKPVGNIALIPIYNSPKSLDMMVFFWRAGSEAKVLKWAKKMPTDLPLLGGVLSLTAPLAVQGITAPDM